jgi:outer membrane protein assembly complex protein YaeT
MAGTAAGPVRTAVVALMLLVVSRTFARPVDELEPDHPWILGTLTIRGAEAIDDDDVAEVMTTRARPWWARWRKRPALDPLTLREDLERVRALYRQRGYYQAVVGEDVTVGADGQTVDVVLTIAEGEPVHVADVSVAVEGTRLPNHAAVVAALPIHAKAVFEERDYDAGRLALRRAYREAGYARVDVQKRARVDLDAHAATVAYSVVSGPACVFGTTRVTGTRERDPAIVLAEVAFRPGEPFREKALDRTRTQLQVTHLFNTVLVEEEPGTSDVVDVRVDVREAPPRDVRLGIGYDTDTGPRGIAGWRHYDFLGGGRQLGVTVRGSEIEQSATIDFLQPHWPGASNRGRLLAAYQLQDEDSYDLMRSSFAPRLEWDPRPDVTTFLFARAEYDVLSNVPRAVARALPGASPRRSILSGIGLGIDAIVADDPIDPQRGVAGALTAEVVGLGGDVHLVRLVAEGSVYHPLGILGLLGAARVRLGVVTPIAGDDEVPLFERFYAGGVNSVRGYERRHVGPLVDGDPLGGRSLVEMSVEIRRTIVGNLGGAVFVDAGQVGLDETPAIDDLQVGTGVGLRYKSPVGPIRVDLGFPLEPPPGDQAWQVHVSIGRAF